MEELRRAVDDMQPPAGKEPPPGLMMGIAKKLADHALETYSGKLLHAALDVSAALATFEIEMYLSSDKE